MNIIKKRTINYSNCLSIGVPCAYISESNIDLLVQDINNNLHQSYKLDLQDEKVISQDSSYKIKIDKSSKKMLLSGGWDAISNLIEKEIEISKVKRNLPYLNDFNSI